jgi:hypothetical protein
MTSMSNGNDVAHAILSLYHLNFSISWVLAILTKLSLILSDDTNASCISAKCRSRSHNLNLSRSSPSGDHQMVCCYIPFLHQVFLSILILTFCSGATGLLQSAASNSHRQARTTEHRKRQCSPTRYSWKCHEHQHRASAYRDYPVACHSLYGWTEAYGVICNVSKQYQPNPISQRCPAPRKEATTDRRCRRRVHETESVVQ